MIRIAISGSHSVGKTTLMGDLAEAIRARGNTCVCKDEPIALLANELQGLDRRSAYLRLLQEHFQRLHTAAADFCFYDRSLVDYCAYMRISGETDRQLLDLTAELLKWYASHIDLFLYLPIERPMEPGPGRPADQDLFLRADAEIRQSAAAAGILLRPVRGSREARLKAVFALLSEALPEPAVLK